jgi:dihydroorotate dehydrogenase
MKSLPDLALPLLKALPPEAAHRAGILALRLYPAHTPKPDPASLRVKLWGMNFPNPVGLAAGFDKHAEVPDAMLALGFGFVEIGTVTPLPQPGNPKPRMFRLEADRAVINRLGFNSEGLDVVVARLKARRAKPGILGANLGKNRDSQDAIADYVAGVKALAPFVNYLTVNVSSPNTPGLRDMQKKAVLVELIAALKEARAEVTRRKPPPLLLKIAPDLSPSDRDGIAEAALESAIDGIIVSNTTVARPKNLRGRNAQESGGLSGKPLFAPSTEILAEMRRLTGGRIPLIGVGGIASGADAYAKLRAGASLVQLYTALAYDGVGLVARIKNELADLLKRDGFKRVEDVVGKDVT